MKAMWIAFGAIILLAVVADYGFDQSGWSSAERSSGAAVRLE